MPPRKPIWKRYLKKIQQRHLMYGLAALGAVIFVILEFSFVMQQVRYVLRPATNTNEAVQAITQEAPVTPNRLWIPAIGLAEVPIINVTQKTEEAYQRAVQDGVGHFPGTAEVGQPGNAYLFGHSSDYAWSEGSYKTIFALIPKLVAGDEIIASDSSGNPHRFRVTETFVVMPEDFTVLDQFKYEKSLLTLQTSYPLGTALKRYIVRAELVQP